MNSDVCSGVKSPERISVAIIPFEFCIARSNGQFNQACLISTEYRICRKKNLGSDVCFNIKGVIIIAHSFPRPEAVKAAVGEIPIEEAIPSIPEGRIIPIL